MKIENYSIHMESLVKKNDELYIAIIFYMYFWHVVIVLV